MSQLWIHIFKSAHLKLRWIWHKPPNVTGRSLRTFHVLWFSLWTSETRTSPTSEICFLFLCVQLIFIHPEHNTQHLSTWWLCGSQLLVQVWFLPPPPSQPKLWVRTVFIAVITSDIWSLSTLELAAFTGLWTDNAALRWKISHPHLHFHIFMPR